jgi:transposase-like protein
MMGFMNSLLAAQLRAKIESQEIGVTCPRCSAETPRTIGWMLANSTLTCPQCTAVIELDTKKLHAAVAKLEQTAVQLDDNLSKAAELLKDASGRSPDS